MIFSEIFHIVNEKYALKKIGLFHLSLHSTTVKDEGQNS